MLAQYSQYAYREEELQVRNILPWNTGIYRVGIQGYKGQEYRGIYGKNTGIWGRNTGIYRIGLQGQDRNIGVYMVGIQGYMGQKYRDMQGTNTSIKIFYVKNIWKLEKNINC